MRKNIYQFIPKDCKATGFKTYDWNSRPNEGSQVSDHSFEISFCKIKHPKIIERTSAAEMLLMHNHLISGCFKYLDCSNCGLWIEKIIESICPQNDGRTIS